MSQETKHSRWFEGRLGYWVLVAVVAVVAAGVTALLMNISERKAEQRRPFIRVVEVTDNDTIPPNGAAIGRRSTTVTARPR